MKRRSMLYFVDGQATDSIKVGYSDNLPRRLRDHANYGFDNLLCTMPGDHEAERKLLGELGCFILRGEEYLRRDDKIYEYINSLLDRGYAARIIEVAKEIPEMPFQVWAPSSIDKKPALPNGQQCLFSTMPARDRIEIHAKKAQNLSISDEWATPKVIVDLVKDVFGGTIDTDPATSFAINERYIQAPLYYNKMVNGLDMRHPWRGSVFLNPPYGRGDGSAKDWIYRLCVELDNGNITQAITMLNLASMSAKWFYSQISNRVDVHCIWNNRPNLIPFESINKNAPSKGAVISYFGPKTDLFARTFKLYGDILWPDRERN